jgi:tetratricopeptide (TPR) repeat protein/tRNA A-37 threonylcarbamoyl transferase component Bud32
MKCPECNSESPADTKFCSNCGAPLQASDGISPPPTRTLQTPLKELTTGTTFAQRYQIIEELGKGGMGNVYKVLDKHIKEKVALKLLSPEIASDEKTIERFRNELKFARKISHRNVCRMYDLGQEEGTHYITMEFVPGEDLKRLIRKVGQLSTGKTILIAKQVCEGLAEAHRLGVVHRDLKPQNIMVDEEGNARIMDFGIARSLKAKGLTGSGVMIGTPEYMSPEQAEIKEVDRRSDIYSLGVILYEMLTGKVPFEGETPLSIAMKHKSQAPRDPKEINAHIPEELSRVILKCMEKDRDKRYQNAEDILSELKRIEEGIPTTERVLPKRRPLSTKEITVTFKLQKLLIPALVVVALAIIGIIIWRLIPGGKAVPSTPSEKPSLAIMYFKNNTGDENLDHWRTMIADLFIADLTQSKYIEVLSGERLFQILGDLNQLEAKSYSSDILKQVAAEGGVNHILVGNYAKAGDAIRINVTLQEAFTGKTIGSEGVEGKGEESIFSMVDELTKKIKINFKLTPEEIASDIDREAGKITTSSPEAYKYYSEGRKYHLKGEERQSIPLMEKAIEIDPDFAMAYRSLAMSYYNLGFLSERQKYMQKALELSDRISDRERYRIQGDFYYSSEKTYDKAIEAYNKLLELYPEDSIGNTNLGSVYLELEEWDKAIERYEVCRKIKSRFTALYGSLADAYRAKGMNEKATEVLEFYLNNVSDDAPIHQELAHDYIHQGKYDLALVEMDKALTLDPTHYLNFYYRGIIFHYKEDFTQAEEEYLKLLEQTEPRSRYYARSGLAFLYLLQGRFEKTKEQIKQGIESIKRLGIKWAESDRHCLLAYTLIKSKNPREALKESTEAWKTALQVENLSLQRWALLLKGYSYLELGSLDNAQKAAAELKEMTEKGINRKAIKYHRFLMGMIELKRENFSIAIGYFKDALSLLPYQHSLLPPQLSDDHALFIEPLAFAYYKTGDLEKAREEYKRITSLISGRLPYGDIYAKSFYMLGKIYQEKGMKEKAIEHYQKFLTLWKDADAGIREVSEAKKQLASLGSKPS